MVQSNSVADELRSSLQVPTTVTGLVMAVLAGAVILGGIKRIGAVAARLVPFMAAADVLGALTIVMLHIDGIPAALGLIFRDAFTGEAVAGSSIWLVIRWGVARGIFSNESGLGSAPIAHAAAKTNDPVRQGMIAMLGTFIDTLVICTMTAMVIVLTGAWTSDVTGAPLSSLAFSTGLPGPGGYIVTFGLVIFAFTTILGWSYYGERCAEYLFGVRVIVPYRLLWIAFILIGALGGQDNLELIWTFADVFNGLMALPNLIAIMLLSPVIFSVTREFLRKDGRSS